MCPIFVWAKEPEWLSERRYPEFYRDFSIDRIDELPKTLGVLVVDDAVYSEHRNEIEAWVRRFGAVSPPILTETAEDEHVADVVGAASEKELRRKLRNATRDLKARLELDASEKAAEKTRAQLEELHAIGIALSTERDHERLLNLILSKARVITSADAGTLFLVAGIDETLAHPDGREDHVRARWLKFRLAQNHSREVRFEESFLAINSDSIAGYVAERGETLNLADAYAPPADKPFVINRSFDETTGYRTVSMLVVPMQNQEGECIGVLQLLNKKRNPDAVLETRESIAREVLPFDGDDERLVRSLASQAAVSVENNDLYRQREHLFERFVLAAVKAIESRDQTTEGHSHRVARMTKELAIITTRAETGPYSAFQMSEEQVRELNYAALLHDFGKVGVNEKVLRKGKKLYHGQLAGLRQRFKTIKRTYEAQYLRKMLDRLLREDATPEQILQMKEELARRLAEVDAARETVETANEPSVLESYAFTELEKIARLTYEDEDGSERTYLAPEELTALSLPRGTLTSEERKEIESHVKHTYEFLSTIPWTRDLRAIPLLARSHHEKLDGSGYPYSFEAADIPPQTRMMTISDIYDALTAKDRPYKPAVKTELAIGILESEADAGKLDRDLLDLFIEARVFQHGIVN